MDNYKIRATDFYEWQNYDYVKKSILSAIKEESLTLSQTVTLFADIVDEICTRNPIRD